MADKPDPYTLGFSTADWDNLFAWLRSNPRVLLNDPGIRTAIAQRRAVLFQHEAEFTGDRSNMIDCTISYNAAHQRERFLESHSARLIWPLMALDPVYDRSAELKVLSVGPRTAGEIFKLVAAGFSAENITSIDVVSNDPLIQVMDAHAMTFADASFDIVILGWVTPYSRRAAVMLKECCRVLRPGGLLAVGLTREPPDSDEHKRLIGQGSSVYLSTEEIRRDLSAMDCDGNIEFSQNPLDQTRKGAILLIVRLAK